MITVAIIGQKGGSGKSSTARLLGVELAARGRRATIIDADVRQRTVSEWNQARNLNELEPHISVELVDVEVEPDLRIREMRDKGTEWLVIDAPGWIDRSLVDVVQQAEAVLIPTGCSSDELRPTMRLYHELMAEGLRPEQVMVLLNRVATDAESRRARAKLAEGEIPDSAVLSSEIPDLPIYRIGQDGGQAAQEVSSKAPRDTAARAAAEIIERIEAPKTKSGARTVAPRRFKAKTW